MSGRVRIALGLGVGSWMLLAASPGQPITVEALRELRERGERVMIVDVRSGAEFEAGHIQGAIHIPARVLEHKALPPLGQVVVVGDGIDVATEEAAAAALNAKAGIRAEVLEGGYSAWAGAGGADSRMPGLHGGGARQLVYADLARVAEANSDLVLVDLRVGAGRTSLGTLFPGVPVIAPPQATRARVAAGDARPDSLVRYREFTGDKLYVLIDDGDGRVAEPVARRLAGAGLGRVAILAGGEQALQSRGKIGVETRTIGAGAP